MTITAACAREWVALRDGRHRWGDTSAIVGRYGVVVRTVTVYPPGSSTGERRWLRAWRSAPLFAVMLFWLCLAGFSTTMPIPAAFAVTAGVIIALLVALGSRCRRLRRSVVQLMTEVPPGTRDGGLLARQATANRLVATMNAAESQLSDGKIDELEFERRWHHVYETARQLLMSDEGKARSATAR
ncbi:DUF6611 family protein [Agromyces lapidis]|uniref:DUF6611 family protein n=1 Tax=Agromyces lapidis TaxID=279574 RepID=A0ABV5SMP7_9MICO|nr:DUF6611 family protein [Agromyces lapidis]